MTRDDHSAGDPDGVPPADDFTARYGESLYDVLDVERWHTGADLSAIYERIATEVETAVSQEQRLHDPIRQRVFPQIRRWQHVPGAGVFQATPDQVRRTLEGLLMTGGVEACDATRHAHETLPLTVVQIGVSLVSYNGDVGTWSQRLFRRDLRESQPDPVEEALSLLERRSAWDGNEREEASRLQQRAIMTYAERAILLKRSRPTSWLLGHGNPVAQELLSGSAVNLDLVIEATRLLEELICRHRRFVFVPSAPVDRALLTIGNALLPLEYAIVRPLTDQLAPFLADADYDLRTSSDTTVGGKRLSPREWMARFRDEVASQVAVGVYRASEVAPARVFYSHVEHAHEAALITLADSQLQPHRGFPMLIDVAHQVCATTLGPDTLSGPIQAAYTRAGVPLRYLGERMSRSR
jgi:hypothetical protein